MDRNASPNLLGWAAMDVWGDMPRDIQEALFEIAVKGRETECEDLAPAARPSTRPCTAAKPD
ncbi:MULTISPECIES: hypothetical protein [unclassified Bradyrhizobium]|uniref:hypothetical protein n=1 Tax=unclassified Bradyrhizobium TaxID=2631580 RepID=UPI00247A78F6|nr:MULTISPECIES: hypothetical protein [unclassified Bradyrhizobium]WGR75364.1 hypothetical protein MTX24_06845 [Bradyrhizobium sp. ISRA426]WGR82991.1 hypothetical protein MTX21_31795 [Bradyrhizobium sp. ISRA430]WGR90568.1 hypothetical protein MTX25_06845 [Bradyrhizobium sp. ISRA432]